MVFHNFRAITQDPRNILDILIVAFVVYEVIALVRKTRAAQVAKGAVVKNCILMQNVTVGEDAELDAVIADKNVRITDGCTLVASPKYPMALAKNAEI